MKTKIILIFNQNPKPRWKRSIKKFRCSPIPIDVHVNLTEIFYFVALKFLKYANELNFELRLTISRKKRVLIEIKKGILRLDAPVYFKKELQNPSTHSWY